MVHVALIWSFSFGDGPEHNLKILGVLESQSKQRVGTQMEIGAIAVFSGVAAAAAGVALVLEHRMDVLYGPYIEGLASRETPEQKRAALASSFIDHLRWKARNMMYLRSIAGWSHQ